MFRLQNAAFILIQYGDWPNFSFPLEVEEVSFRKILGITDEHVATFYERARDSFEREDYEEAADICLLLTRLDPEEATYWVALGMSEQLKGSYQMAASAYAQAIDLNQEDLTPGLYAARCLIDLGEVPLARSLLVELLHVDSEEDSYFITEAKELLTVLEGKS